MKRLSDFAKEIPPQLFGRLSWSPPAWVRFLQAHRRAVLLGMALLAAGLGLNHWWQNRPRPDLIAVRAQPIEVTPLADKLEPRPLRIDFGASAAPLAAIGKTVAAGMEMEPSCDGKWQWTSDRHLVFFPRNDWPAGQAYRIRLGREVTPVALDRRTLEVRVPSLTASVRAFEFYQDPKDPSLRQLVATIEFSHAIRRGEIEARAQIEMLGRADLFPNGQPRFTVDYGPHDRVAYLRSAPLRLPEAEDFARLTLPRGLRAAVGGDRTAGAATAKVKVPDLNSFFRISAIKGSIVRKTDGEPEQVLLIETTAEVKPEAIAAALDLRLLPPRGRDEPPWQSPREITPAILEKSTGVPLVLIPAGRPTDRQIAFRFKLEQDGRLYVRVKRGIEALGGYPLASDFDGVLPVPQPPLELRFEGEGGILALGGERKLAVTSRGIRGIHYEIARVRADQINHLISQTGGSFQNPDFISGFFNEENIARIAEERQPIAMTSRFAANHSTFDFGARLGAPSDGGSERGLFFLRACAWNPQTNQTDGPSTASRFVLVTDLGLLAKFSANGSADVFVVSLRAGAPAAGVEVTLLAKNGVALARTVTGPDGHASIPRLTDTRREKEPVAFVARLGEDISFLPYERQDRELDFSRFEIGGVSNVNPETLDAFAFSERGIYRPGDTVHLAWAVKQRNWAGNLEGLPLEIEVTDARGKVAYKARRALTREAFATLDFPTRYESPSGRYRFDVYLVRENYRDIRLGGTEFTVKEFLPDRMKLETRLNKAGKGWISPDELTAQLTLRNLYGTAASNRRIASRLELSPTGFSFPEYPGYTFHDRLLDPKKAPEAQSVDLPEQTTAEDGTAQVSLGLDRFANATWQLRYYAEAFEGNSGRCVSGFASAVVSSQPWLIGHKADGDLGFIQVGSRRTASFLVVDATLARIERNDLEGRLIERRRLSMLVKKPNGTYGYETVEQDQEIRREAVVIPAEGLEWTAPASNPGDFVYELWNPDGVCVSRLGYRVVGAGETARSLDRNAELQVRLDKEEYAAGEAIQVSIQAPYAGSGLITIESNGVHAFAWFRADSPATVQTITLPPDFEGTGYISVAFVRSLDSREIFMSPLSYGVVPFRANFAKRRVQIDLDVPAEMRPGERLTVRYRTDRPARIILFAVDKGILQVTRYRTPEPLEWFFRKTRLETRTTQIVDLLIPEFSLLRELSAPGGGEDARLNPFRRVTSKPVVWWSGLLNAGPEEQVAVYDVPDEFSGELQVMAVAIAPDSAGSAEKQMLVRGPFVITPGVPLAVAPGDEFEAGITVANNLDSPESVVRLEVEPSPELEVVDGQRQELRIAGHQEVSTTVRVRVRNKLGAASLRFIAASGSESSRLVASLSVRPSTPFLVEMRSAHFARGTREVILRGGWYDEFRQGTATVSAVPLGLARGLEFYLRNFPHGCTEQTTSGAFARMVVSDEADFGLPRPVVQEQMNDVFAKLRTRQDGHGRFGYWSAGDDPGGDFLSAYVMHFLIEARAAGFDPPEDLLRAGLKHLREIAADEPATLRQARTVAYAIYLLTREQVVTTNYLLNLQDALNTSRWAKIWKSDLLSAYLAASWEMLKKPGAAGPLINGYRLGSVPEAECGDFYDDLSADSRYLALLARHFPERLRAVTPEQFAAYLRPIGEGRFNTLSAAYAVLALKSFSQLVAKDPPDLSIAGLTLEGGLVRSASLPAHFQKVVFGVKGKSGPLGIFAQSLEAGYPSEPPTAAVNDGMEVWHEYLDEQGAAVTQVKLGKPVTVRVVARSTGKARIGNVAVVDLVPGGFEVVPDSLKPGRSDLPGVDFVEVREDRVVLFGELRDSPIEWTWQLRPTSLGRFVAPPAFAESMYDRRLKSHSVAGVLEVTKP